MAEKKEKESQVEDDVLFKEIDEELRQDQLTKLWQEYGKYAMAGTVAIVVGVAGFKGWEAYDVSSRKAEGERFAKAQAAAESQQLESAFQAFDAIEADGRAGYPLLARFQKGRMLVRQGDSGGAAAVYRGLSEDDSIDPIYRNLALILGAVQELNTTGADMAGLEARLKPLMDSASPWRFSATEITGLLALRTGNRAHARKLFASLAGNGRAPQGVRARAQEMLSIIGE